jgi:hypothetical protein
MRNLTHKQYFYAIGLFLLATIAGLWSWNTLSELFNFPQAQYKHVLAVFILLLILKSGLSSNCRAINRVFGGNHENSNH